MLEWCVFFFTFRHRQHDILNLNRIFSDTSNTDSKTFDFSTKLPFLNFVFAVTVVPMFRENSKNSAITAIFITSNTDRDFVGKNLLMLAEGRLGFRMPKPSEKISV